MRHSRTRRTALAVLLSAALTLGLTGCIGTADRNLANWLEHRAGVTGVAAHAEYPEFQYHGYVDATLDPKASDQILQELVTDTVDFMAKNNVNSVDVDFGIDGLQFGLTGSDSLDGLALWQQVRDIAGVLHGYVFAGSVQLETLRGDGVAVLHLAEQNLDDAALTASITVDTYVSKSDLPSVKDEQQGTYVNPVTISTSTGCDPADSVRALGESMVTDDALGGTIDLCDGIDMSFVDGTPVGTMAVDLRAKLGDDHADYPVSIGALAPGSPDGTAYHSVTVTPGDPAALGVLAALDAGAPVRYELDTTEVDPVVDVENYVPRYVGDVSWLPRGSRTLSISSAGSSTDDIGDVIATPGSVHAEELFAMLAASPAEATAGLGDVLLDDGAVAAEGTMSQLTDFADAAAALQRTDDAGADEIEHLTIGALWGELVIRSTGRSDTIPGVEAIAAALHASGLAAGRDIAIIYDNQRADVVDGVSQVLDPSHFNNDDEVLQAFLDAWTAVAG